jgi:hypothetical protein
MFQKTAFWCNSRAATAFVCCLYLLRAVENGGGGRPKMVALGW